MSNKQVWHVKAACKNLQAAFCVLHPLGLMWSVVWLRCYLLPHSAVNAAAVGKLHKAARLRFRIQAKISDSVGN